MSGRSQAVRILAQYPFSASEVYIRRNSQSGDLILSQAPGGWDEIYTAIDNAGLRDDFLAEQSQGRPQQREEL